MAQSGLRLESIREEISASRRRLVQNELNQFAVANLPPGAQPAALRRLEDLHVLETERLGRLLVEEQVEYTRMAGGRA